MFGGKKNVLKYFWHHGSMLQDNLKKWQHCEREVLDCGLILYVVKTILAYALHYACAPVLLNFSRNTEKILAANIEILFYYVST